MLNVFVAENLLGGEGQGAYILMSGLDVERAIATSGAVGWVLCFLFLIDYMTSINCHSCVVSY